MTSEPLVSVLVITYNSARYVTETLDSIAAQTYRNIELIVSDDHSSDTTCDVVSKWLDTQRDRFVQPRLIRADVNTGIAGNCNRALKAATGEWIKLIAGDDLLFETGIQGLVDYIRREPESTVVFGRIAVLRSESLEDRPTPEVFRLDREGQLVHVLKACELPAPASFVRRKVLLTAGGYDETIPMIEDVPMWARLLSAGHSFRHVDVPVAKYRLHDQNVSRVAWATWTFSPRYLESWARMLSRVTLPLLWERRRYRLVAEKLGHLLVLHAVIALNRWRRRIAAVLNLGHAK